MKLYKTKKNCGKLLLGILAFCTGMILLTGCGSSSEQKQNKNEETAEENKEEDKVQIGLTVDSFVIERWIRDRDVFVATASSRLTNFFFMVWFLLFHQKSQ